MTAPFRYALGHLVAVLSGLVVSAGLFTLGAAMLRVEPGLIGLLPLPALAGFWAGVLLGVTYQYLDDDGAQVAMAVGYAGCVVLVGVAVLGPALFESWPPVVTRAIGWTAVAGALVIAAARTLRDWVRWVRTGHRRPPGAAPGVRWWEYGSAPGAPRPSRTSASIGTDTDIDADIDID
ncbi:hypothetical protein [Virgisporangium ochraceum]|uniref:hypothetical protein n=1 Tax=Virgisporangium ochraceum TaxID=65505 RepID=UPI001942DD6E|nr:hypothetical protein [Virgisporangium ochraceum]